MLGNFASKIGAGQTTHARPTWPEKNGGPFRVCSKSQDEPNYIKRFPSITKASSEVGSLLFAEKSEYKGVWGTALATCPCQTAPKIKCDPMIWVSIWTFVQGDVPRGNLVTVGYPFLPGPCWPFLTVPIAIELATIELY